MNIFRKLLPERVGSLLAKNLISHSAIEVLRLLSDTWI